MNTTPETPSIPESPSSQTACVSVGAALRAAREAQGLSVADVAERVKFSVRQVEALEADDAEHLPEGAFLRGFVRSYARVLRLDEAALLAALPTSPALHGDVSEVQAGGSEFPTTQPSRRKNVYLLGGALLAALVLGVFVWSQQAAPKLEKVLIEEIKLPEVMMASAVTPAASGIAAVSSVEAPDAKKQPEQTAPVTMQASQPKETVSAKVVANKSKEAAQIAPPAPGKAITAEPAVVAAPVSAPLVSGKQEMQLAQLKKRPIHIVFNDEAWMEIIDTNGEVLLSRMNAAGSEKWIGGGRRAPYQVAIGKVSAVRIYYKGREVDMSQYKQTGLVHLVLE